MAWHRSNRTESCSRPLLYLTSLPVFLALCAFLLQWHGYLDMDDYHFNLIINNVSSTSESCADILGPSKKFLFPYYRWRPTQSHNPLKVCITSTTSAGLEQLLPWIYYHKIIGVTHFILFVGGKSLSNDVADVLESFPEVEFIHRTQELEELQAESTVWSDPELLAYLYQPCNYELFVNQSLNMEMAIVMAREAKMDWIFHLDTDELLHPAGTRSYSVQELLSEVPQSVDVLFIVNYESCVERDDIKDPFSEVSMFKKAAEHMSNETFHNYFGAIDNPIYFLTYRLFKSGARVQDGLSQHGPHAWKNEHRRANIITLEEAAVLHYSYSRFSDTKSKISRCNCNATVQGSLKCFFIEFDWEAFLVGSAFTEEEMHNWYDEHVIWFDTELKAKLLRVGVFERIYDPMVIFQGLKESGIFADIIASALERKKTRS